MYELNRVVLSDCVDFLKTVPDDFVDLTIIDPPYVVTGEDWDKTDIVTAELSKQILRVSKPSASFYCWGGVGEKSQTVLDWFVIFKNTGWYFKDWITWKKQRGMGNRRGWLYTREELLWFVKSNNDFIWNKECQYSDQKRAKSGFAKSNSEKTGKDVLRLSNVWTDITESTLGNNQVIRWTKDRDKKKHFTPKPEKAIERVINSHTKNGDMILDCFMGSGTTGYVAKKLGRTFIGCDNNEQYVDMANSRILN